MADKRPARRTDTALKSLIERAQYVIQQRNTVLQDMRRLVLGEDQVFRLKGLPPPSAIKTLMVGSQLGLLVGMTSSAVPMARVSVASLSKDAKEVAQSAENYLNSVFPVMDQQNGIGVWDGLFWNQAALGFAVDAQDMMPTRLYDKLKALAPDDPRYKAQRLKTVQERGLRLGTFPIHWRLVNSERFWWREDEDGDGLALAVEWRTRPLAEVRENPRYAQGMPQLNQWYAGLDKDKQRSADLTDVDFFIVEDRHWTYMAVTGATTQREFAQNAMLLGNQLNAAIGNNLQVCDVTPNHCGRVRYTVTAGFRDTAEDDIRRYQGLPYKMQHLARRIDDWYTVRWTRAYQHAAAAWAITQATVQLPDGGGAGYADETPGTDQEITFEPGKATVLPPGTTVQPVINPYNSPEEQSILMDLKGDLYGIGINPAIFDPGDSGYAKAQMIASTMAKFKPLEHNTTLAHYSRMQTHIAQARLYDGDLGIMVSGKEGKAEWYDANPADWDEYLLLIEPVYNLSAPQDLAADTQNAVTLVQTGFLSYETAYEQVLHMDDWEGEKRKKRLEQLEQSPQIQQTLDQQVLQEAGFLIQQDQQQQDNNVSAAQVAAWPPDLQAAAQQATPPGAPGYGAIQQALGGGQPPQQGQAGIRQPQPAGQQGDLVTAPAKAAGMPRGGGGHGGRAAGQKRRPPRQPAPATIPGGG